MKLLKYLVPLIAVLGFATMSPLTAAHGDHSHGDHSHGDHHGDHGDHHHGDHHHGDHHHGDHHEDHHHEDHLLEFGGQDRSSYQQELNQKDWDALRDYLRLKREEKAEANDEDDDEEGCNLTISGDVRTEWRHLNEKGINQQGKYRLLRGANAVKNDVPVSRNDFDIEFNLRFDYICDKTWAVAHLDFDNSGGVDSSGLSCDCDPAGFHGSGNCDSVCLKKAYVGYNVYECRKARFDIEIGRRNIYNVFDSQIQFLSRFDGIVFKYSDNIKHLTDWYWNTAGFIVDERVNHYAWITEFGLLDICDSKIDFKYSFIDWEKHGKNRCFKRNPRGFRFMVSQWTTAYHFDKKVFGTPAKLYGAISKNHAKLNIKIPKEPIPADCKTKPVLDHYHKGQPWGWYVGFTVGEVVKEGDFAFNAQYEWVQATAMPDEDAAGIGRGNVLNENLTRSARGNTNYKGFKFEFLYALTDNFSIDAILEFSREIKRSIGGRHHYSKMEVESIYAF